MGSRDQFTTNGKSSLYLYVEQQNKNVGTKRKRKQANAIFVNLTGFHWISHWNHLKKICSCPNANFILQKKSKNAASEEEAYALRNYIVVVEEASDSVVVQYFGEICNRTAMQKEHCCWYRDLKGYSLSGTKPGKIFQMFI